MCTQEEVKKIVLESEERIEKKLVEVVKDEVLFMLPVAIGKGIKEAETHLQMSKSTKAELERHEHRIAKLEFITSEIMTSMKENALYHKQNNEFHEQVRPILESIQKNIAVRDGIVSSIFWWAKVIGSIAVILGSISGLLAFIFKMYS